MSRYLTNKYNYDIINSIEGIRGGNTMDNIYKKQKHDSCKQKKSNWQRSEWYGYNSKFRKKDSAFSKILAGIYKIFSAER
jgi:hypothetical protein